MSAEAIPQIFQPDAMVGDLKLWRAPDQIVAEAQKAAQALQTVIDGSNNKPIRFGDKEHLKHEHWEMLGHCFGYSTKIASTESVEFDEDGERVFGFLAAAELLNERTGIVVGRAEAMCLDNEEMWGEVAAYEYQDTFTQDGRKAGRQRVEVGTKSKPWFQLRSMAQTRASAKAFRHKLAWVAVLAGYNPTPAEEMQKSTADRGSDLDSLPTEIKRKPLTPDLTRSSAAKPVQSARPAPATRGPQKITVPQCRRFFALWREANKPRSVVTNYLQEKFGISSDREIPADRYEEACAWARNPEAL